MNKTELISAVADKMGATKKDATAAVAAFTDAIEAALVAGDKVQLVGFGTFEVRERGSRKGRNPKTGKEMVIKASRVPVFKAGKALKDSVAK